MASLMSSRGLLCRGGRVHSVRVAIWWLQSGRIRGRCRFCQHSQPNSTELVSRKERDGSMVTVPCPSSVTTYNKNMAGVDKGDQIRKYYSVRLKCKKNYKYIFWFLFDVCITNAFILTKFDVGVPTALEETRLKQFRTKLAKALIGDYNGRKRTGRPSIHGEISRTQPPAPQHFPRHHPRQRCVYCQQVRNPPCRRESRWQCQDCDGWPSLCLTGKDDGTDCWHLWHN